MSFAKEETLSPEELRKRLYQTFKSKGVLDALKVQLRNQLIKELKHPDLSGGESVPRTIHGKSDSILVLACNSIVAEYLQTSGYEYTLSVFHPESGLAKDKVLTKGDLIQLLNLPAESSLCITLASSHEGDIKGFLMSLLTHLTHRSTCDLSSDAATQTCRSYGDSLVEKMKMIDREYESLDSRGDQLFSYQSKLEAYRKETEAQMQAEMKTKMEHFKEVEVAKVKMEENAKSQKEFEKLKQDLQRAYELKAKALMEREKNAIDRLQKQQEIEEKNSYMQRQGVLKEIETVRSREKELKLRTEAFEETCKIHEEKIRVTEDLLRRREGAVKTLEDTYDQRLSHEVSRYQLELKEEFIRRTEKLTESEHRNKVETTRIQKESAAIDAELEEHSRARSELRRLQAELETSEQQVSLLSQQKELLRERLEAVSDYSSLMRDRTEAHGELRQLRTQLEEAQVENQILRADLRKPSKEQLALQMELQRLQNARRLDEEEFENQKQVLQAQLQTETQHCAQVKAQLMECEEKCHWMTNHIEEIKVQLRQTHQALENEVLLNPKPSLVDRSVLELGSDKLVLPDVYVDRAVLRARVGYDDVCEAGGAALGLRWARSESPDSDSELVAGAKARIQELQKEAETLEEAYRNYQQRAVHSTISHMLSSQQARPSHRPGSPLRRHAYQRCQPSSPDRPKLSHRSLSQQTAQINRTPSPAFDTRSSFPHPQPKVTFSEDQNQLLSPVPFSVHSVHSLGEPLFLRDGDTEDGCSLPPTLRPSSPKSTRNPQTGSAEEVAVPASMPALSFDRPLPRSPQDEVASSGGFSSDLSPPRSPKLSSTAREEQLSAPQVQQLSSSESSPQPEKITMEDLTWTTQERSHIPELLLDTAVPLSEEAPDRPAQQRPPAPQDLLDAHTHVQGQTEARETAHESASGGDKEDEKQRWEGERRDREEQRQRELEDARQRELLELQRLEEEETIAREAERPQQEEEEIKTGGDEEEEVEEEGETSAGANPLDKYMKMVMEAKEKPHSQSLGREEPENTSPASKSPSEKDDSIAAFSQEAADDDFW
ncbi:centriole and centriolar satellite protein ofd1 isoform X2 [Genypterus blacodes]|uniref:centriole and centriolar satellite protein ofd1 isoform X2 n=1 Tax=Genypterus blacodes TaxID=154954 RepID=UPI003F7584A8